ncbi:hypothetical protein [Streptomyces sp. NPDC056144]|uniref:hypothetical protein n=1 Tax=unclassified Streptomyces TaxID=2593676 RepID=UPI0035DC95FD
MAAVAVDRPVLVEQPATVRPAVVPTVSDAAGDGGPSGFAETVVGLWLEAGAAAETSPEAAQLRVLAPGVRAPRWGRRPVVARQMAAVRIVSQGSGAWVVTVAVRLVDGTVGVTAEESVRGLRYFTVPVTATGDGRHRAYVAGAPGEAAGPRPGQAPDSPFTARVEDPALTDTVEGFLGAFLGSGGTVERYLAPGTVLARPDTRFAVVEPLQVLSQGRTADSGRKGVAARVRAEVTATDAAGRSWPMAYELTLTARDGRWEIAALDTGQVAATARRP